MSKIAQTETPSNDPSNDDLAGRAYHRICCPLAEMNVGLMCAPIPVLGISPARALALWLLAGDDDDFGDTPLDTIRRLCDIVWSHGPVTIAVLAVEHSQLTRDVPGAVYVHVSDTFDRRRCGARRIGHVHNGLFYDRAAQIAGTIAWNDLYSRDSGLDDASERASASDNGATPAGWEYQEAAE